MAILYNSGGTAGHSITINSTSSDTSNANWQLYGASNPTATSQPCNESKTHNNEEKALFHGIKSAYRMSREFDGEYGTDAPPYEQAAHIAARVAIAYLETTDTEYDREESVGYIHENVVTRGLKDWLLGMITDGRDDLITDNELEDGIARAWEQIDGKWHHDDGARTALAIAEAYLGEELWEAP